MVKYSFAKIVHTIGLARIKEVASVDLKGRSLGCVTERIRCFCPFPVADASSVEDQERTYLKVDLENDQCAGESVIVIGINPSKAITGKSDRTITIVSRVMKALRYREMIMLNLFTCFQTDLHKVKMNEANVNTTSFKSSVYRGMLEESDIIIAWGVSSDFKKQKVSAVKELLEIVSEKRIWCINKDGKYPLHPRVWKYNDSYRFENYIKGND